MSFGGFVLRALGIVLLLVGLLAWPAQAWDGSDGLLGLGLAAGITLVGAAVGHLVAGVIRTKLEGPQAAISALNAGIGSRLLVTLALSLVVIILQPFRLLPFATWLAVFYVALLCLEVFVGLRGFGQNPRSTEATAPKPDAPPTREADAGDAGT